jgi:hypothetical protein
MESLSTTKDSKERACLERQLIIWKKAISDLRAWFEV